MTESYDSYANAVAENGVLKQEFIDLSNQMNIKTMQDLVSNSVKMYNEIRPHYSCFMETSDKMHLQRKIRTYKNKNPVNKCQLDSIN
ncbi:MAG: putative transposase [Spirosomataceae bacterium]|jgi:putative transposase